jgi:hypothetical protein
MSPALQPLGQYRRRIRDFGYSVAAVAVGARSAISASRLPKHKLNKSLKLYNLGFCQPFFLQLGRGKWTLLLLISVGPAVVRRRRLKFANRTGCSLDRAFSLAKPSFGSLPGAVGQRVVEAETVELGASSLAWSKIEARSASRSLMR